jgi:hypothetical protein
LRPDTDTYSGKRLIGAIGAVGLLAGAITFFAAARWLPPIETGGDSKAVYAGYTNWITPLVAILLVGSLALGAFIFLVARDDAISLQSAIVDHTSWKSKTLHIVAAALLCLFVVAAFPVWSTEDGYFGQRLTMMTEGLRPYRDFEYAYGYIVAYLPYALHLTGLSIRTSLILATVLFALVGVTSFAFILERTVPTPKARIVLFWLLVTCELFVEPGPSLNYNFGRYALPFVVVSVVTESLPLLRITQIFATFAGAVLLLEFVSPEIAFGCCAGLLAWLVVICREISISKLAAAAIGMVAALISTLVLLPDMFTTFFSYASVEAVMPIVPNPIMVLAVLTFMTVGAINFTVALSIWRGGKLPADAPRLALPAAYALLSAALLPALIGRSWPTITIAYGFVPIIMTIGYALQSGAKRMAWTIASIFAAFVLYSAQFALRIDSGYVVHYAQSACVRLHLTRCTPPRNQPTVQNDRLIVRATVADFIRAHFPGAYDPLAAQGASQLGVSSVGYYVGLTDIVTDQGLDRKIAELDRAPYYILPVHQEVPMRRYAISPERFLSQFTQAALYPFPLNTRLTRVSRKASFVSMLYQRCREVAAFDDIIVCGRP